MSDEALKWMEIALGEMGQREIPGIKANPRIVEYHQSTTLKAKSDEVPWCASFVSWVLDKADLPNLHNAWAEAYRNYGDPTHAPEFGDIVVFKNHVGFYVARSLGSVYVLGGNQDNSVSIKPFSQNGILAYRRPHLA